MSRESIEEAVKALRQALETEQEQEPVAWADAIIDDLQGLFDTDGITEQDSGDALIRLSDAIAAVEDERKRYTSPPKKEWVGLTDEEIARLKRILGH